MRNLLEILFLLVNSRSHTHTLSLSALLNHQTQIWGRKIGECRLRRAPKVITLTQRSARGRAQQWNSLVNVAKGPISGALTMAGNSPVPMNNSEWPRAGRLLWRRVGEDQAGCGASSRSQSYQELRRSRGRMHSKAIGRPWETRKNCKRVCVSYVCVSPNGWLHMLG